MIRYFRSRSREIANFVSSSSSSDRASERSFSFFSSIYSNTKIKEDGRDKGGKGKPDNTLPEYCAKKCSNSQKLFCRFVVEEKQQTQPCGNLVVVGKSILRLFGRMLNVAPIKCGG